MIYIKNENHNKTLLNVNGVRNDICRDIWSLSVHVIHLAESHVSALGNTEGSIVVGVSL